MATVSADKHKPVKIFRPARRLRLAYWLTLKGLLRRSQTLLIFIVDEQRAASRWRIQSALRIAAMIAAYASLMAILHVQSGTAQYAMWLLVAPPGPMMRPLEALGYVVAISALSGLSVPLAGTLSEAPGLMLLFVGGFTAVSVYAVNALRLGARGFVMQLILLEASYIIALTPENVGWQASATLSGYLIAFFVIVLFDNVIWPNPAEPILIDVLNESLRRLQESVLTLADLLGNGEITNSAIANETNSVALMLTLVDRAVSEGIDPIRRSWLLNAITRVDQFRSQLNQLSETLHAVRPDAVSAGVFMRIGNVLECVAAELEEIRGRESLKSADREDSLTAVSTRAALSMLRREIGLRARSRAAGQTRRQFPEALPILHLLEAMHGVMSRSSEDQADAPHLRPGIHLGVLTQSVDRSLMKFSIKTAVAVVVAWTLGLIGHDIRLWVAPVTVFTVAFPAYGTAVRRMILRLLGSTIGGGIMLVVIVLITPNFFYLPTFIISTFVVVFIAGYTGLSSEKIAYAGRQIGDVYIILFMGLGSAQNIYDPFWRILGVFLGIVVPGIVYSAVWRQRASDFVFNVMRDVLRRTITISPGGAATISEERLEIACTDVVQNVIRLLDLAEDARLEGPLRRVAPNAVVAAAETIRRIVHLFAAMNLDEITRHAHSESRELEVSWTAAIQAIQQRLEAWIEYFGSGDRGNSRTARTLAASHSDAAITGAIEAYEQTLEEVAEAEPEKASPEMRERVAGEVGLLRIIARLMGDLDRSCALIPVPSAAAPLAIAA